MSESRWPRGGGTPRGPEAQAEGSQRANHTAAAPIGLLLSRLQGVRKSGRGWQAKCPSHEDRHASLSVGEASRRGWSIVRKPAPRRFSSCASVPCGRLLLRLRR
jgi:hypothetical protein